MENCFLKRSLESSDYLPDRSKKQKTDNNKRKEEGEEVESVRSSKYCPPVSDPLEVDEVWTHTNCIDGSFAALMARVAEVIFKFNFNTLKKGITFRFFSHGSSYPQALEWARDKRVFLVDYSFDELMMIDLLEVCKEFSCWDHHRSNKTMLESHPIISKNCRYSEKRSGACLSFDFFFRSRIQIESKKDSYPLLLQYVEDHDLQRFELGEKTRFMNAYIFNVIDYSIESKLETIYSNLNWSNITHLGNRILEKLEDYEARCKFIKDNVLWDLLDVKIPEKWFEIGKRIYDIQYKQTAVDEKLVFRTTLLGHRCGVINTFNKNITGVANRFFEENDDSFDEERIEFILFFEEDLVRNKYRCNMRRRKADSEDEIQVDCGLIAKTLDEELGGGHPGAAAFNVLNADKTPFRKWLDEHKDEPKDVQKK